MRGEYDPAREAKRREAINGIPVMLQKLNQMFTINPVLKAEVVGADQGIRKMLDDYPFVSGMLRDAAFTAAIHMGGSMVEVAALFYPGEEQAFRAVHALIKARRPDWLPRGVYGKELGEQFSAAIKSSVQTEDEWQRLIGLFPQATTITDFSQLIAKGSSFLRHVVEQAQPKKTVVAINASDPLAKFLTPGAPTATPSPGPTDPLAKFLQPTVPGPADPMAAFLTPNGSDPRKILAAELRKVEAIMKAKGATGPATAVSITADRLEKGEVTPEQAWDMLGRVNVTQADVSAILATVPA